MKTNLEIFNEVEQHLLKQKARSHSSLSDPTIQGTACAYRGYGGMKCAVGCLIKDEHFNPGLNTRTVINPGVKEMLKASGITFDNPWTLNMLIDLQSIHDTKVIEDWPHLLKQFRARCEQRGVFA